MTRRALKRILSFLKAAGDFLMHVAHAPKGESTPDPAKEAARQVGEAMHVSGGGVQSANFSGSSAADGLYGKVLADGHKRGRKRS